MSKLLEIFGKAMTVNVADVIWHWVDCVKDNAIDKKYRPDFESALDSLAEMDLDSASKKLGFYLFENPECAVGRMVAAAICLHKNCVREAIEQLNSVYVRQPSNTIALYAIGNCYERLGLEAQAVEFYQDALKFKSYLELPRKRLAAIHYKNGNIESVVAEYEQIVRERGDDIDSLVMLGNLYLETGKYAQAEDVFNRAILIHPDNFHMENFDEVDRLVEEGEYDGAGELLMGELAGDPNRADLCIKLGDVYTLENRDVEALTQYEHALSIEPLCLQACVKAGTCELRNGNLAAASKYFVRAMEINDEIVDAYIGLATSQNKLGKDKDCLGTFSLASAIMPNTILLFVQAAIAQFRMAQQSQSFSDDGISEHSNNNDPESLRRALFAAQSEYIAANNSDADGHYRFGLLMLSVNRTSDAAQSFERALETNQHFHRAKTKLAICNYELGQKTQAVDIICKNKPIENELLDMYYRTAILYTDRGRFEQAAKNMQATLTDTLNQFATEPALANVLQNLGLMERGSATLEYLAQSAYSKL